MSSLMVKLTFGLADSKSLKSDTVCIVQTKPTACHRVLGIKELAEAIFLQLRFCDVYKCVIRVCRDFHHIIEQSQSFQTRLHAWRSSADPWLWDHVGTLERTVCGSSTTQFREASANESQPQSLASREVFEDVALAERIFGNLSFNDVLVNVQRTCYGWCEIVEQSHELKMKLYIKPNQKELLYRGSRGRWARLYGNKKHRCPSPVAHPLIAQIYKSTFGRGYCTNEDAIMRPEASWRSQLVAQPPLGEARIATEEGGGVQHSARSQKHGVTLGELASGEYYNVCKLFNSFYSETWIIGESQWKCVDGHGNSVRRNQREPDRSDQYY